MGLFPSSIAIILAILEIRLKKRQKLIIPQLNLKKIANNLKIIIDK